MNRITASFAALALAGTASLQAADTDPKVDYNVLQSRIATLEGRISLLETALEELNAQVTAEPSPTQTGSPSPKPPATVGNTTREEPKLPSPAPQASTASAASTTDAEVERYTITEGDTISEIARKLGVPRSELMEANNLREGQQIYIGDQLIVPQPEVVEEPKQEIAQADPAEKAPAPTPEPKKEEKAPAAPETADNGTYIVKSGDTLSRIAREHGITISAIKTANNLSSDLINLGQSLKIPGKSGNSAAQADENTVAASDDINKLLRPEENYGVYTVERGDTLYSLSRDFFTTPAEIQRLNQLGKSTSIRPGQDLVVPTSKYEQHHNLAKNG